MYLHLFYAVICYLCSVQLIGIVAYPTLIIPRFYGPTVGDKYKKSDLGFPQIDETVLELEHLKRDQDDKNHSHTQPQLQPDENDSDMPVAVNSMPELERQLELATLSATVSTSAPTTLDSEQHIVETGVHRPPMLPHNNDGKVASGNQHSGSETGVVEGSSAGNPAASSMAKPYYGAARLAFGQNPEVLPTSSTSTSTTTTTTTNAPIPASNNEESSEESPENEPKVIAAAVALDVPALDSAVGDGAEAAQSAGASKDAEEHTKESLGDTVIDELERVKSTARRSVTLMPPKSAERLLRHRDGQYSSFDMAQYVFWTGDEAGVARAVGEFIEQGLMTRENALKFLRDIRLGIEYLQSSYANRVFPEEMRQNNVKKSNLAPAMAMATSIPTTTVQSIDENPSLPYEQLKQTLGRENSARSLDSIAMWNKLEALKNTERHDLSKYDEASGRAKIAEFLYTEYTLEEILYKLAKVMFTQSLARGSDEAQQELQKLTDFLEREGNMGVIPIDLQKKVLHVLLSALSDTLNEHPELLAAARLNLANPYSKLPLHTYGTIN